MARTRKKKTAKSTSGTLDIKILGVEEDIFGKRLVIKLPRMRKARKCHIMPIKTKSGSTAYILQADNFIMEVYPKSLTAIYNTRCEYFPCLNPIMGAKKAKVTKEFVEAVKAVAIKKGDLIGVHPEGSPIYFAGGKEI